MVASCREKGTQKTWSVSDCGVNGDSSSGKSSPTNSMPCDENNPSGIISSDGYMYELLVLELPEDSVEGDKKT